MANAMNITHEDMTGSVFQDTNMSGAVFRRVDLANAVFDDVNLGGARFFNVNLRRAEVGAIDFGGSSVSCMNTGEDRERVPATIKSIELDESTVSSCHFRNTKFVNCDWTGATIDGVPITELIARHWEPNGA